MMNPRPRILEIGDGTLPHRLVGGNQRLRFATSRSAVTLHRLMLLVNCCTLSPELSPKSLLVQRVDKAFSV